MLVDVHRFRKFNFNVKWEIGDNNSSLSMAETGDVCISYDKSMRIQIAEVKLAVELDKCAGFG